MTALPDPAELAPSRDPAVYGRRRMLSAGFWAAMVFCALCMVGAVVVVTQAPHWLNAHPVAAAPVIAQPVPAPAPVVAALPAPSAQDASPEVAALADRVTRLEGSQARFQDAATAALAAAALSDAAAQPRPFADELAAFQRALPGSPDAQALSSLALQGAPTRAALAAQLGDLAAKISVAARTPGKNASIMAQIAYAISRVVDVRRVDAVGSGPDAVLTRAERVANDGDLAGAVAMLDTLAGSARTSLAGWREQAERRVEIDRHIAGLRTQALADLVAARTAGPGGQP